MNCGEMPLGYFRPTPLRFNGPIEPPAGEEDRTRFQSEMVGGDRLELPTSTV